MQKPHLYTLIALAAAGLIALQARSLTAAPYQIEFTKQTMREVIGSIPSPIEIADMLKSSGAKYQKDILNPTENKVRYGKPFRQALALGVYGADLGYININNDMQSAVQYMSVVQELARELNIDQFFDFKRLENIQDMDKDSLINETTRTFAAMNEHLARNDRETISILILAGGWLESLHIAGSVYETTPNDEIRTRIAEQKVVLTELMLLLQIDNDRSFFIDLNRRFSELESLYKEEVEINQTTTSGEMETIVVDGEEIFVGGGNTKQEIDMSEASLDKIITITDELRRYVIR